MGTKKHTEQVHSDSQSTQSAENGENTDFESAMRKLEEVILTLEQDDLTLDTALKSFEDGVGLMRLCDHHLQHARGKITQLLENDESGFTEKVLGTTLESFLHQEPEHE